MPPIARILSALRVVLATILVLGVVTPAAAEEIGTTTGEVVFRVTLTGPVDSDDAFVIWSQCPDEWCQTQVIAGGPREHPVIACGQGLADQVTCSATTYEWTVELVPGTLEYRFERFSALTDQDPQILHTGTWEVHLGRQVLSLGYTYPSTSGAGQLPDTALPAP